MISETSPIAFSRSTVPSEKPPSSTRGAPMTVARRTVRLSARCSTAPLSNTAAQAACRGVGPERLCDPGRRHLTADDALAVIGLEPIDAAALVGQPAPNRQ